MYAQQTAGRISSGLPSQVKPMDNLLHVGVDAQNLQHIFRRSCELGKRFVYMLVGTGRVVPEFPHPV
jgi:hypothetical protein